MAFRLRHNLHWCDCGGRAIFLDVAADRYFCLSHCANEAFARLARGLSEPGDNQQLDVLVGRGLLIDAGSDSSINSPPSIEDPTSDFWLHEGEHVGFADVAHALLWELRVSYALAWRPFSGLVEATQRLSKGSLPNRQDCSRLIRGIVGGSRVAALITRSHDRCLVRAFSVYSCCRKTGLGPQLVIGVTAHPFAAHSWVQLGNVVLVGGFEQARLYTPILVIE